MLSGSFLLGKKGDKRGVTTRIKYLVLFKKFDRLNNVGDNCIPISFYEIIREPIWSRAFVTPTTPYRFFNFISNESNEWCLQTIPIFKRKSPKFIAFEVRSTMMKLFELNVDETLNLTFDCHWIGDPNPINVQPIDARMFDIYIHKSIKKIVISSPSSTQLHLVFCLMSSILDVSRS